MPADAVPEDSASRARVRRAAGALRRLFAERPAGLLTDVDGTVSRITAHTNDAGVSTEARHALARLATQLDVVAVVTGRAVERARRMVGVGGLAYVGNHGLEWLRDGVVVADPAAVAARPALEQALGAIRAAVSASDLIVEDKGVSIAVHYRMARDPIDAGRRVFAALAPHLAEGAVRLIQGGLVVNLLPNIGVDKGEAARRLIQDNGLRSAAFFGDDVTDIDAFRVLRQLRGAGAIQALAVGVSSPQGAVDLSSEVDLMLEGVGEVERVLVALAARPPRPAS